MPQTYLSSWLQQPRAALNSSTQAASRFESCKQIVSPDESENASETPQCEGVGQGTPVPARPQALPKLPSNVSIEPCTKAHLHALRRLNSLLLPIPYKDDFYKEILNDPVIASLTRVALWHEKPPSAPTSVDPICSPRLVASIRCRLLSNPPNDPSQETPILYISTITTLAPFRRLALGNHLLQMVTRTAVDSYGVVAVMAHVWEANEDGLEWYKNRGFRVVGRLENYYRRLAPQAGALLIRWDIGARDLIEWQRTDVVDL